MEKDLNTWLMGFIVEVSGVEMMVYHLVSAEDLAQAEAGAVMMGRSWWEGGSVVHENYSWRWPHGSVWFNSIILLSDVDNHILRGLRFLDAWVLTGSADEPEVCDEYGNNWRDITR